MFQAFLTSTNRLLQNLNRSLLGDRLPVAPARNGHAPAPQHYLPLTRLVLTDGVSRTLFEEYAAHRRGTRGDEETGWVLLGRRDLNEATVLATLPAGAERDAGVSHVQFNPLGQALGSRIVRQRDKRLTILGVVHTHPGSLRHPSDGDLQGDSAWVSQLRGREGIFAIGTADGDPQADAMLARQPKPNVQCLGEMCLSWYALGESDPKYRPLPFTLTLGPDLARPLHPVWPTIELHAERLDRLYRQQAGVVFDVAPGKHGPALAVHIALAEPGTELRVFLEGEEVRYYVVRDGELLAADPGESNVDRGVYLLLAELAAQ
jgi:proteasome lid subunit RPN8/RPN11